MSVSVAAATRPAKVDAFSSWSACSVSATSNALTASGVGPLAGQHVEEVGGVAHRRIRRDRSAARLQPAPGGDDRAGLRREPHRLAVLRLRRRVVGLGVVVRQRRRQRAQRVHAVHRRQAAHQPDDRLRAAAAPRPAATAGRRARRASAAGGARAGSRPLRRSRAAPGRGCRSRSRRARRARRRDSRSPTTSRRRPRARLCPSLRSSPLLSRSPSADLM